jgi:hypothetical protein
MISGSQLGRIASQEELAGTDQVAVLAGQTDRRAAVPVDEVDDLLVHQPAEDHLDHVHGLGIRDPHPLHELARLAETLEQRADLRPAAMHDHRD